MNLEQLQHNARDFWVQGRYDLAAELYEQAIADSPNCFHYWHLGLMYLLQDQPDQAQAVWFAAIVEIAAADLDAAVADLGQILLTEARRQSDRQAWRLAEAIYSSVLEFAPVPAVWVELGRVCAYQGDLDRAIESWHQAIALQPDCAVAYRELGQVWQKLAQFADAIAAYTQAIALEPLGELHHNLGLCLTHTHQWQAAMLQLQHALQLQPNAAAIRGDLAQVLLQQGDWAGAIAHFQAAVHSNFDFVAQYGAWVQSQGRSQPLLTANLDWLQALSQDDSIAPKLALAQLLLRSGQIPVAIQLYEHLRSTVPADSPVLEEFAPVFATINSTKATEKSTTPPELGSAPSQAETTTEAWQKTQPPGCYRPLNPSSLLTLDPPRTIDPEIHFSFRFPRHIPLGETFVAEIPQGSFWINPQQSSNAVMTVDRQLLRDLSPEFPLLSPGHPDQQSNPHTYFISKLPPVQQVEGTIAVLTGLSNSMYFHWMFDLLPRLDLLDRSGIDRGAIDSFLVSHHLPFQQETLAQLGVPAHKILTPEQYPYIQATRLLVPSFPGSPAWMPQWACQWLRQQFLPANSVPSTPTRLYISRSDTTTRRVINEAAIVTLLEPFGFQCVTLESLSVREQAALLATAEVVISPHGGGLTNLVFCRPGTIVIEIFPPYFVYPCYWLVSNLVGLKYYYLIGAELLGAAVDRLLYPNPRLQDIWVDPESLQAVLKLSLQA
jgi:tetratricopeptide (TPR) repeat protein